ncbi:MAG: epoxyqueuosine reductase, partial [Euryarchaeota archaeon]|nr:epoxyqueuosine reductase [Euryarchaeota archaeon]
MKSDESLTTKLKEKSISNGADLFGVAPVTGFLNSEYTGGMPQEVMDSSHSVIVIGVALLQG